MKWALVVLACLLVVDAGKLVKSQKKGFNHDGLLIGPGNCIIMGDMVHECDGSMRRLSPEEKHKLREQREQAEEDFRQHMPQLPPCFPYCKGNDGKRDGQHNLPYRQECKNGNGEHNVNFDYNIPACFPFCKASEQASASNNLPPCFPFCNRIKRVGANVQPFSPCRSCSQSF